mmetsp:Transcript_15111/g.21088  ORF Transcript_15111/g.21088 Transcript_15111/m.21088 type:complete len:138 (-) Transcript_15111:43-456(-)
MNQRQFIITLLLVASVTYVESIHYCCTYAGNTCKVVERCITNTPYCPQFPGCSIFSVTVANSCSECPNQIDKEPQDSPKCHYQGCACDGDSDCDSGNCPDGTCHACAGNGWPCSNSGNCCAQLTCLQGVCRSQTVLE